MENKPNNYLGLAIACIIFCWPLGIPAIINAVKVNSLWDSGKQAEAFAASEKARKNATIGLIIGVIINVLYIILAATGALN